MSLPPPSEEQIAILDAVASGNNIQISAVAGSGKTTIMLMICKQLGGSKCILALIYNARLKDEMRAKIERLGFTNVEAHSYNAFFVRYYGTKCCTDSGILDVLDRNEPPRTSFRFGCVILDEVQDMTPLYLRAAKKLIRDMTNKIWQMNDPTENTFDDEPEPAESIIGVRPPTEVSLDEEFDFTSTAGSRVSVLAPVPVVRDQIKPPPVEPEDIQVQLCLFGDPNQNIYGFKDADERFLTLSDVIWNGFPRLRPDWKALGLGRSFRVTKPIAQFVNMCLGYDKIHSDKPGKKVKYMICNSFGIKPTNTIKKLLTKYQPSDFFIVAPSIRTSKSAIKKLENNLVAAGFPCFVPMADDEILQQDVINGKIVFSSIHQTKGLERKVVMLFNFDATYFKFYNRDDEPSICSNALYVGMTRAMEELILVHDRTKEPLAFLDMEYVYNNCEMTIENYAPKKIETPDRSMFSVIDLTRHLTVETMNRLLTGVELRKDVPVAITDFVLDSPISIPTVIRGNAGDESVADVNGICLPAIYEFKTQTHVSIVDYIRDQKGVLPKADQLIIEKCLPRFNQGGKPELRDFLYLSNVYNSLRTGYRFKLNQIDKYDWIDPAECKQALQVVKKYIPTNARFEQQVFGDITVRDISRNVSGVIDAVSVKDGILYVWEFKCVKELQSEHILQVLIYMWMFTKNREDMPVRFCLLNILSDTVIEIMRPNNLDDIIKELVMEKIKIRHKTTDAEFLASLVPDSVSGSDSKIG